MVLPSSLVILLKGGGRVACCDLRWMQGYRGGRHSHPPRPAHAETCALPKLTRPDPRTPRRALCPSSPAQPWAQSFPPADPPIASQSITRGALFPGGDGEHLEWSFQARLLLAPKRWIGLRLRLARGAGRCHSDRLLAMARRSVRRSIRAKPRIDQVCGAKE